MGSILAMEHYITNIFSPSPKKCSHNGKTYIFKEKLKMSMEYEAIIKNMKEGYEKEKVLVLSQLSENEEMVLALEKENFELKSTHEGIISMILTEVVQIGGVIGGSVFNVRKENVEYSIKHLSVMGVIVTKVVQNSFNIGSSVFKLVINQFQAVVEQSKSEFTENSFDMEMSSFGMTEET